MQKPKSWWQKTWHFLWHDDSILAWIANVIIAFLLIKFIIYPGVGLLLGTQLPVVAVVSSSMDHRPIDGSVCGTQFADDWWSTCGSWYEQHNISQEQFSDFIFPHGFWKGDVMILYRSTPENTQIGDILVFTSGKQYPIIHRIVDKQQRDGTWYYQTKGDHNEDSIEQYAISDGRYFYLCYQQRDKGILPSLCGPGTLRVTRDIPGAIPILDELDITQDRVVGKAIGRIPLAGWLKIGFVSFLEKIGLSQAVPLLSA